MLQGFGGLLQAFSFHSSGVEIAKKQGFSHLKTLYILENALGWTQIKLPRGNPDILNV